MQRLAWGMVVALCFFVPHAHAATEDLVNGRLSGNWSGYVATHGEISGVGAAWHMQALAATTTLMTDVTWVGVGGSKSKDLVQAGTQSVVQNGIVQYFAWYELLPDYLERIPVSVSAGDAVRVSLIEVSDDLWLLSFANETTGAMYHKTLWYSSRHTSAEWIQEMPSVYRSKTSERVYAPLSEFGNLVFSDAYAIVDGKRTAIEDTRARAVTMVSKLDKRVVLSTPSELEDGGFSVARSRAVPSPLTAENAGAKKYRGSTYEIRWSKP